MIGKTPAITPKLVEFVSTLGKPKIPTEAFLIKCKPAGAHVYHTPSTGVHIGSKQPGKTVIVTQEANEFVGYLGGQSKAAMNTIRQGILPHLKDGDTVTFRLNGRLGGKSGEYFSALFPKKKNPHPIQVMQLAFERQGKPGIIEATFVPERGCATMYGAEGFPTPFAKLSPKNVMKAIKQIVKIADRSNIPPAIH